jgi:protease I
VLISGGICQGVKMTGSTAILDDLRNAGATLETGRVIVDRNVVTSGSTNDLPVFMKAVVDVLAGSLHPEHQLQGSLKV